MKMSLTATKIWVANDPVDFRKAVNGLTEIIADSVSEATQGLIEDGIYVFYNRAKNKLKLLARHRNGVVLIYKRLDKKHFTLKANVAEMYEITEQQLAWLLAGLDWVNMSEWEELTPQDYY